MLDDLLDWGWIGRHLDDIAFRIWQHFSLSAIALVLGFLISFGLALLIYRRRRLYGPIAGVAGILYTIPSLALFAVLVPITGLSIWTAEIALVGYTLLIYLRTMMTGLDGVPTEVREAASGMGFTAWQRLWRIELPLALPSIVTGARVAAVTTVGLVTVAGLVGQGGLGRLIVDDGLRRYFPTPLYVGSVLSIALALLIDLLLLGVLRGLTPWSRRAGAR
ncbi:MAG: ABC transporter permease [Candidatus Limnocylindrales bacterium]